MAVVLTQPITKAQLAVLICIANHHAMTGFSPSLKQIADMLALKSTNAIRKHIARLKAGKFVTHTEGLRRDLALTPLSKDLIQLLGNESQTT